MFVGMCGWFFIAPVVQAKPHDRPATGIICVVLAVIVVALFWPTVFLEWHAKHNRR